MMQSQAERRAEWWLQVGAATPSSLPRSRLHHSGLETVMHREPWANRPRRPGRQGRLPHFATAQGGEPFTARLTEHQ